MQTVVESYIKIMGYKIVRVPGFVEVGSMVSEKNHMTQYIRWWIQNTIKCYYGLQRHFKSWMLTHEKKIRLHQTLVRHSDVQKQNMGINTIR